MGRNFHGQPVEKTDKQISNMLRQMPVNPKTQEKFFGDAVHHEMYLPFLGVQISGKEIQIAVPNEKCYALAKTVQTREPDTNSWICGFASDDIFFDVGASIGVFTLIAATVAGCRVWAFEPHYASYYILVRNIFMNELVERVRAYPLALAGEDSFGQLYISEPTAGKSLNNFGEKKEYAEGAYAYKAEIPQGAVSATLDTFADRTGVVPNHIKIDVDGLEKDIIANGTKVLSDPAVKSVCIEITDDNPDDQRIVEVLRSCGFSSYERPRENAFFSRR